MFINLAISPFYTIINQIISEAYNLLAKDAVFAAATCGGGRCDRGSDEGIAPKRRLLSLLSACRIRKSA